jgi:DNA-binding CsgD family transcriptional regulator
LSGWRARYEPLSDRERAAFRGVVSGKLNKQIAADIGVTDRTVKAHRANVRANMVVGSTTELVRVATEAGLAPELEPLKLAPDYPATMFSGADPVKIAEALGDCIVDAVRMRASRGDAAQRSSHRALP